MSRFSNAIPPGFQENQLRPSATLEIQLFTPLKWFRYPGVGAARPIGTVDFISVVNTGSVEATYSIYHDDNGTTYDLTTLIIGENITIEPQQTHLLELGIAFKSILGTIGVKTSIADALLFIPYVSFPSG